MRMFEDDFGLKNESNDLTLDSSKKMYIPQRFLFVCSLSWFAHSIFEDCLFLCRIIKFEPEHDQTYNKTCD